MVASAHSESSGSPKGAGRQYVWSARYIDAAVLRDRLGVGDRVYFLTDANFNVTTLVNTDGDAVEHYQYDPYGRVTVLNGAAPDTDDDEWTADPNNTTDVDNHTLYTGRWQDFRTSFYDYRNRYYHRELGRFINRDPIGYNASDANLYRYVGNGPTNAVDPSGLDAWEVDQVYPYADELGQCYLVFKYRRVPKGWFSWLDWADHPAYVLEFWWKEETKTRRVRVDLPKCLCTKKAISDILLGKICPGPYGEDMGSYARAIKNALISQELHEVVDENKAQIITPWLTQVGMMSAGAIVAITITPRGLTHVQQRHIPGGSRSAGKSTFYAGEDVAALIRGAGGVTRTKQAGGNFQRIVDAGRMIGIDRATGRPTSVYTVITNAADDLITAFPGTPL